MREGGGTRPVRVLTPGLSVRSWTGHRSLGTSYIALLAVDPYIALLAVDPTLGYKSSHDE